MIQRAGTHFINSFYESLGEKEYFTETFSPDFDVVQKENSTVIKVKGLKNLRLCGISLVTPSMFKRNVTFDSRASKMLYNLSFENVEQKDLTLSLEPYKVTSDTGEIVIDNKDDKPMYRQSRPLSGRRTGIWLFRLQWIYIEIWK